MKRAVVLGASGGMGYSLVHELTSRGIDVIAFARTKEKLERLFNKLERVQIVTGDVLNKQDVRNACQDVDAIFLSVVVPYPEWYEKLPIFTQNVLDVAKETGAKLILVDNVYAYGRSNGKKVTEEQAKQPHTRKGKLRLQMEEKIKSASADGVKSLIVHLPDYYGPNAENTLMHMTLQPILQNKKTMYVGNLDVKKEFIYTPDGAKAIVELALRDDTCGENWNIPAYDVISGREIMQILEKLTGYNKKPSTVSKRMIQFLGLFTRNMREIAEMMYLNEEPVVLSGEKYEKRIGALPRTSYEEGLKHTLQFMKEKLTS